MNNPNFGDIYVRAEDLIHEGTWCETPYVVTAAHAPGTFKAADGKPIDKDILELEPGGLRMIVGATNWRLIRYATGIETKEEVVGQQITLYPAQGNWFGQKNVAAVRVRIPSGNFRPFVKASNLGVDITGKKFTTYQKAVVAAKGITAPKPKVSPGTRINACKTDRELQNLITSWIKERPFAKYKEEWAGIVGLVIIKTTAIGVGDTKFWTTFVEEVGRILKPQKENDEAESVSDLGEALGEEGRGEEEGPEAV